MSSRGHGWTARLLLLVVGLGFSLAVAELGIRIVSWVNPGLGRHLDTMGEPALEKYSPMGYRQRPLREFRYANGSRATSNAQGFRGPTVAVPKPEGTFRILLFGGSTTHGWAVDDRETIDAYMREQLGERYPGWTFDVVNLAFDGYDSYQIVERLRHDGLPLDPDLVIVNAGVNDVRNARFRDLLDPDPRALIFDPEVGSGETLVARVSRISYLARLLRFLRQSAAHPQPTGPRERIIPNPDAAEYYERNLRRVVELLRDRRVPILFSNPPSALATKFEPDDVSGISYWLNDAAETEAFRRLLAARTRRVFSSLDAERYPAGLVGHDVADELFSDDCHLTPEGNRHLAREFVAAAAPYIERESHAPATGPEPGDGSGAG